MLRTTTVIGNSALTTRNVRGLDYLVSNTNSIQCVRWKRKPIWLPTAKSKMFRIPERPCIPNEDSVAIQTLYNNYRTYMNSLRSHLVACTNASKQLSNATVIESAEREDFRLCKAKNDAWNLECAAIRNTRLILERQKMKAFIADDLAKNQERDEDMKRLIEEQVRQLKREAHNFITAENIDSAIDKALESTVNHNMALDANGNFHSADGLIRTLVQKTGDCNESSKSV